MLDSGLHKLPPYKLLLRSNCGDGTAAPEPAKKFRRDGLVGVDSVRPAIFPVAMQPYDRDACFSLAHTTWAFSHFGGHPAGNRLSGFSVRDGEHTEGSRAVVFDVRRGFRRIDPVLLQLAVKRGFTDTQQSCSQNLVAIQFAQGFKDGFLLLLC
jgi:hypothetical protein